MQIRKLSFWPMTSINLSYGIIGSITKCHNDSFDLKFSSFIDFKRFSVIFTVFIKFHEYAN